MENSIIFGDCLEVMRELPADSVDSIVTDPPYGIKFMGKDWDHGIPGVPFWVEALRVAKPGAHLLAFGGTRTFHRLTCAIEDAGWEIRDCLGWIYGSGFPKSHNLKGEHEGWGTALKPAWEPIILARNPFGGTVAENVQKWGTGAINVDGCRVEAEPSLAKNWDRVKSTKQGIASTGLGPIDLRGRAPSGRWPANLLHDGSEEVLELFPQTGPTKPHGGDGLPLDTCGQGWGFKRMPCELSDNGGSAARFFKACPFEEGEAFRFAYCAKASRKEREMGCEVMESKMVHRMEHGNNEPDQKTQSFITHMKNNHPTVKPLALMRYLCRIVTKPDGLVLDPFCGSGSTLIAAKQEGFRYIGIDNNEEYCEIARNRLTNGKSVV